jgi:hypothetical protein
MTKIIKIRHKQTMKTRAGHECNNIACGRKIPKGSMCISEIVTWDDGSETYGGYCGFLCKEASINEGGLINGSPDYINDLDKRDMQRVRWTH